MCMHIIFPTPDFNCSQVWDFSTLWVDRASRGVSKALDFSEDASSRASGSRAVSLLHRHPFSRLLRLGIEYPSPHFFRRVSWIS